MRNPPLLFSYVIWAAIGGLLIEMAWWVFSRPSHFVEMHPVSKAWDATCSWTGGGCEL